MDLLGIGSIVQGLTGMAQGAMESRTARRNTDLTNKANRELAEYGYSKDLEMWERANEYNNPANQMLRMKEAGLNPNMVYGSGKVAGNTASQLPKYNVPKQEYNYKPVTQLPQALGQYMDFKLKNAQYDNERERGRILSEEANAKETENRFREERLMNQNLIWGQKGKYAWGKQQWEWADNDNKRSNNRLGTMLDYDLDAKRVAIDQKEQAIQESIAREATTRQSAKRMAQDIAESKARTGLIGTNASLNVMKRNQLKSAIDMVNKQLEWYETRLFSDMGFKFLGSIKSLLDVTRPKSGRGISNSRRDRDWSQWKNY